MESFEIENVAENRWRVTFNDLPGGVRMSVRGASKPRKKGPRSHLFDFMPMPHKMEWLAIDICKLAGLENTAMALKNIPDIWKKKLDLSFNDATARLVWVLTFQGAISILAKARTKDPVQQATIQQIISVFSNDLFDSQSEAYTSAQVRIMGEVSAKNTQEQIKKIEESALAQINRTQREAGLVGVDVDAYLEEKKEIERQLSMETAERKRLESLVESVERDITHAKALRKAADVNWEARTAPVLHARSKIDVARTEIFKQRVEYYESLKNVTDTRMSLKEPTLSGYLSIHQAAEIVGRYGHSYKDLTNMLVAMRFLQETSGGFKPLPCVLGHMELRRGYFFINESLFYEAKYAILNNRATGHLNRLMPDCTGVDAYLYETMATILHHEIEAVRGDKKNEIYTPLSGFHDRRRDLTQGPIS